jgi:UDP-GlcNAc:undecaprenyl-phosphate GlcNAc-1-phosphate transferase
VIGALLVVGVVVVLSPRARRDAIAARQAEVAAQKERSRADHPASRGVRGEGPGPVGFPPAGPSPTATVPR